MLYLGFFIIFSFSHDDDAFEEFREWLEQKILLHIDYNNGDLFVFLFIFSGLMIDSTYGTDETRLILVVIDGDDKRDDDPSNNDENERTCRQ